MNDKKQELVEYEVDGYNGINIKQESLGSDELKFARLLQVSLRRWEKDGRKGVWITVPITKSHFVPILVELGFEFHHSQPKSIVLCKWLPKNIPNTLPRPPEHIIGVGGFVVNDKNEILVIKEKHGFTSKIWKIPGGRVDAGEDLHHAAIREVFEETGIKTVFVNLLAFRLRHAALHGATDIYFTCLLKPLNNDIRIQESEIADAKWMPLEEFLSLPYYKGLYLQLMQLGKEAHSGRYHGFIVHPKQQNHIGGSQNLSTSTTTTTTTTPGRREEVLYHGLSRL